MGKGSRERRWIIHCDDGRHVTIGRHSDPTEEELTRAGEQLNDLGLGGWLAVTEGQYHSDEKLSVMMVRELRPVAAAWDTVVENFLSLRRQSTKPAPSP